ncbi:hypothetical protein PIB30_064173 [Stylosanthes scabra]|uniref:Fatty acid hydroxylase domain-containing protein n=1 Tax=Stylosanthes scabra TaxID=79078 RepID=A0ABU6YKH3_9FABA|nr:hypothetical protein [Stylosanthes scabra]
MLPYKSLEEAEVAIGRGLTHAETIWFKYSSNKSDFVLHFHNIIFFWVFYSFAPIPFLLIELSGNKKLNKYKIQPKEKKSFWEMFKCYKHVIKLSFYAVLPLQIVSYAITKWIGIGTGLPLPSGWELICQLVIYFMVEDYTSYWLHRMVHNWDWAYEKIHKVHHEYETPFALSAPYSHWSDVLILSSPALVGPAMVPCHIITYWLWFIFRHMEALDTHSGYEFPWSLTKYIPFYVGAKYHDYHHYVGGRSKCNFSTVFTYCDYLYGTNKGYQYAKQIGKKTPPTYNSIDENHHSKMD